LVLKIIQQWVVHANSLEYEMGKSSNAATKSSIAVLSPRLLIYGPPLGPATALRSPHACVPYSVAGRMFKSCRPDFFRSKQFGENIEDFLIVNTALAPSRRQFKQTISRIRRFVAVLRVSLKTKSLCRHRKFDKMATKTVSGGVT
jgi:hypothetical protein